MPKEIPKDESIFTEAAVVAAEVIKEIESALAAELTPFLYTTISPEELASITFTPDLVNGLAGEFNHDGLEQEPCPACQLVASKYGLE